MKEAIDSGVGVCVGVIVGWGVGVSVGGSSVAVGILGFVGVCVKVEMTTWDSGATDSAGEAEIWEQPAKKTISDV